MAKRNEGDIMEGIFAIGVAEIFATGKCTKSKINHVRKQIDSKLFQTGAYETKFDENPKAGKDPDHVIVNLKMRLKHGSVWEAYGPNFEVLYKSSHDVGNIDTKLTTLVQVLNTKYQQKIKAVKDKWLKNHQVDEVIIDVNADGQEGEASGGMIKGDIMVTATMNGDPVMNGPMSFSMKSGSSTLANLSPYNGMIDLMSTFGATLPNEEKYRTTLGDTLRFARSSEQKRMKFNLLSDLYKETMDALLTANDSKKAQFKKAAFDLFRSAAFGDDLAHVVDIDKTKIKEIDPDHIDDLEKRCVTIDLRRAKDGGLQFHMIGGQIQKSHFFFLRFKKRPPVISPSGDVEIKELKFYIINGPGAYARVTKPPKNK